MIKTRNSAAAAVLSLLLCLSRAGAQSAPDFTATFIHVNDTHSRFEPAQTRLKLDLGAGLGEKQVYVELGGFPQAADVINRLRARAVNPVLIHSGDFFQGSLYFTKYEGEADLAFWDKMGLTAATLGNHEFDKGPSLLAKHILGRSAFPVVVSNVDFSRETVLGGFAPKPYIIKDLGKQRIGFVGAVTEETAFISSPGKNMIFGDPVRAVQKAVDELTGKGVNKIVLISHLGYDADRVLAARTTGVDVIIGAHSHTLLGDWTTLGLSAGGRYPTVLKNGDGDTVLVVQAWEWAKVIGDLKVDFDAAGKIVSWAGTPAAVVGDSWFRVYDLPDQKGELKRVQFVRSASGVDVGEYDGKGYAPVSGDLEKLYMNDYAALESALAAQPALAVTAGDPGMRMLVAGYQAGIKELQTTVAAQVGEDMRRGLNSGMGPIVADAMRAKTGARIALYNAGGIRSDLAQGPLTVAQVYEVIPFGNTLVVAKMKGSDVIRAIEDGVEFGFAKRNKEFSGSPLLYVSGVKFDLNYSKPDGSRLSNVLVLEGDAYKAIDLSAVYTVVMNSFMAAGGDLFNTLKAAPGKIDTGYIDAEALLEYVKGKTLKNAEPRINPIRE